MILVKEVSRTAVDISLRHWMQVSFFFWTSSVRQAPQNLWLHGWILTGMLMISQQKEQVICSLISWANLSFFSSFSFFAFSSFLFYSYSSFRAYNFAFYAFASFYFLMKSSSTLNPIVSLTSTLLAGSSHNYWPSSIYSELFFPTFLIPINVPFALKSETVTTLSVLTIEQCLPLSLLSLILMVH